jgi:hypothetical protein
MAEYGNGPDERVFGRGGIGAGIVGFFGMAVGTAAATGCLFGLGGVRLRVSALRFRLKRLPKVFFAGLLLAVVPAATVVSGPKLGLRESSPRSDDAEPGVLVRGDPLPRRP